MRSARRFRYIFCNYIFCNFAFFQKISFLPRLFWLFVRSRDSSTARKKIKNFFIS